MKYLKIILLIVFFLIGYLARDLGLPFNYTSQSLIRMNPVVPGKRDLNNLLDQLSKETLDQLPKETLDEMKGAVLPDRLDLRIQYGPFLILANRDFSEYRISFTPEGRYKGGWYIDQKINNNKRYFGILVPTSPDLGLGVYSDIVTSKPVLIRYHYGNTFYSDTDADGKWNRITVLGDKYYSHTSKDGFIWKRE